MIKIKRTASGSKIYAGVELNQNSEYTIANEELRNFASDLNTLTDALSGDIEVYSHANVLMSAGSQAVDALKDLLPKSVSLALGITSDTAIRPRGFCGDATRWDGSTGTEAVSNIDWVVDEQIQLKGAKMQILDPGKGDWLSVLVVHPVAGVLKTYSPKWVVFHGLLNEIEDVDLSSPLPTGLILRIEYHSVTNQAGNPFVIMNLPSYIIDTGA